MTPLNASPQFRRREPQLRERLDQALTHATSALTLAHDIHTSLAHPDCLWRFTRAF